MLTASLVKFELSCSKMLLIFITGLIVVSIVFWCLNRKIGKSRVYTDLKKLHNTYLTVYLLATFCDWIQSPYVYVLYESYNISKHDIEIIFIASFASSIFFGTIVGLFADKYGRRFNCILYAICNGVSCLTKHSNDKCILIFSSVMSGISSSILNIAFESWIVYEHKKSGFEESSLTKLFATSYFANLLSAILAGILAQFITYQYGFIASFELSFVLLVITLIVTMVLWAENYGDQHANYTKSFINGCQSIIIDQKIFYLGLIQSLFEVSIYVFVFEWTPVLKEAINQQNNYLEPLLPYGLIFAIFMVAIMFGSYLFQLLCNYDKIESFMRYIFVLSSISLSIPFIYPKSPWLTFVSFVLFEICVGIFWPSMSTMRSRYIPEKTRSTIMSFFRIILNLIIIVLLLNDLTTTQIFSITVVFLFIASILQDIFYKTSESISNNKSISQI